MADTPEAKKPAGSKLGFLGRKIGPVPIWVIAIAAVAAYYWWTHFGPGSKTAAAPAAARGTAAQVIVIDETRGRRRGREPEPGVPPVPPEVNTNRRRRPRLVSGRLRRTGRGSDRRARQPVLPVRPVARGFSGPPSRGTQPAAAAPVTASAPMTAGDIYGSQPTAMPDGQTYDSGNPAEALEAAGALAG